MKKSLLSLAPLFSACSGRCAAVLLFALATWSAGPVLAADGAKDAGVRLLKGQLPEGTTIQKSDCETLARAVNRATTEHRSDASAILKAALTNGNSDDEILRKEDRRTCECVGHIVRASIKAAPGHASEALEVATALYPDCADSLAAVLDEVKKEVAAAYDYKDRASNIGPTTRSNTLAGSPTDQPVAGIASGLGDPGSGLGPGFPGAPGFGGSSPSGGIALPADPGTVALPTPAPNPVTNVVNQ